MKGITDSREGELALVPTTYRKVYLKSHPRKAILITRLTVRYGMLSAYFLVTIFQLGKETDFKGECVKYAQIYLILGYGSTAGTYLLIYLVGTIFVFQKWKGHHKGLDYFNKVVFPNYKPLLGVDGNVLAGVLVLIISAISGAYGLLIEVIGLLFVVLAATPVTIYCFLTYDFSRACILTREKLFGNWAIFRTYMRRINCMWGPIVVETIDASKRDREAT
mmetsp:Transcript_5915/g.8128  ORF Transcript_5915/g.8128 Transcript_5915/m.8128 type:complete len:220 (+) Transcript_5915:1-660(+)